MRGKPIIPSISGGKDGGSEDWKTFGLAFIGLTGRDELVRKYLLGEGTGASLHVKSFSQGSNESTSSWNPHEDEKSLIWNKELSFRWNEYTRTFANRRPRQSRWGSVSKMGSGIYDVRSDGICEAGGSDRLCDWRG